ncbi:MAG: hypothetical protein KKF74_00985, partial [Nanoarchaeota archaeon]|nr:hypothetical protein [Nanoarchaeota archaeon]
ERILTTLFGVTKQFTGRVWNSDVLFGLGETKNPENSIIITNKRIIFAVIPLHGQGKYVGGEDISSWNFLFGRKYIKKKGEEIIDMMNPQEILEFDKNNFEIPLNQLKEVKIKNFFDRSVTFFTNDGKKFKYVTGKKEHIIKIKDVLSSYILSK